MNNLTKRIHASFEPVVEYTHSEGGGNIKSIEKSITPFHTKNSNHAHIKNLNFFNIYIYSTFLKKSQNL